MSNENTNDDNEESVWDHYLKNCANEDGSRIEPLNTYVFNEIEWTNLSQRAHSNYRINLDHPSAWVNRLIDIDGAYIIAIQLNDGAAVIVSPDKVVRESEICEEDAAA